MLRLFLALAISCSVFAVPKRPTDPNHISSAFYEYAQKHTQFKVDGRKIDLYLPISKDKNQKFPVIIFGHGQSFKAIHYELMFKHLAQKGFAVIHPMYDTGFFDQNWKRMAKDFNDLSEKVIRLHRNRIDVSQVTYAGHSKGGYISLYAASLPMLYRPKSIVVFTPAVFNQEAVESLPIDINLKIVWGEEDSIVDREVMESIFSYAPSVNKELIVVEGYEDLKAEHFYILTKKFLVFGNDGLNAHHFFTVLPLITNWSE